MWTACLLGDLVARGEAEVKTGPFGTQLHASDYVEYGTPVINVRNIGFGHIRRENLEYISEATVRRLSTHLLRHKDIVFGRKGAVERHVYIKEAHENWFQGSDCLRVRLISEKSTISLFLSYYFLTEYHRQWMMQQCSHGATMASLNQDIIKRIPLMLPPPSTQRRISSILSAYDDLIENNTRRIAILEEMARRLYEEWFIHFRFPGHETTRFVEKELGPVPEGWEVQTIRQIIKRLKPGRIYKQENVESLGSVIVIDQSRAEILGFHSCNADHLATATSPIAIFGDHTCKMQILTEPFSLGPNTIAFTSANEHNLYYVYSLISGSVSTKEYKRHWGDLISKDVLIADEHLSSVYSQLVMPWFQSQDLLLKINRRLRAQRDLLLPKLISGELGVSEAEEVFEEVAA